MWLGGQLHSIPLAKAITPFAPRLPKPLPIVYSLPFTVCCSLFTVHYPLAACSRINFTEDIQNCLPKAPTRVKIPLALQYGNEGLFEAAIYLSRFANAPMPDPAGAIPACAHAP
jgi:hypothetical protein